MVHTLLGGLSDAGGGKQADGAAMGRRLTSRGGTFAHVAVQQQHGSPALAATQRTLNWNALF